MFVDAKSSGYDSGRAPASDTGDIPITFRREATWKRTFKDSKSVSTQRWRLSQIVALLGTRLRNVLPDGISLADSNAVGEESHPLGIQWIEGGLSWA